MRDTPLLRHKTIHEHPAPIGYQRRRKPQRGDPFQSPGCAALKGRPNPGLAHRKKTRALQGRPSALEQRTEREQPSRGISLCLPPIGGENVVSLRLQ